MPAMPENPNRSYSIEFLLAEYNQISEETRRLRAEGLNRLNFFITLTSSVLGGVVLLSQLNITSVVVVEWIALGTLLFLAVVGWNAFRFTVSRDINTDFNIRATARIRRFFVEHDPQVGPYLTWHYHDEPTGWIVGNTSNLRGTTQLILALLLALTVGLVTYLLVGLIISAVIVGLVGFALALALLIRYARHRFEIARKIAEESVRFSRAAAYEE